MLLERGSQSSYGAGPRIWKAANHERCRHQAVHPADTAADEEDEQQDKGEDKEADTGTSNV